MLLWFNKDVFDRLQITDRPVAYTKSSTGATVVNVNPSFVKGHSEAKCRSPAYSQALLQVTEVIQSKFRGGPNLISRASSIAAIIIPITCVIITLL